MIKSALILFMHGAHIKKAYIIFSITVFYCETMKQDIRIFRYEADTMFGYVKAIPVVILIA